MATKLRVSFFKESKPSLVSANRVIRLCQKLAEEFKNHPVLKRSRRKDVEFYELTLVFLNKSKARSLNKKFRKRSYATDVLSFSPEAGGEGLGDLVFCPDILIKQAKDQGHSFKKELDYMVIHGFLHLLGYDHEKSRREELKMVKLQDKLFSKFSES
jgi:probable rRNA maturation factor